MRLFPTVFIFLFGFGTRADVQTFSCADWLFSNSGNHLHFVGGKKPVQISSGKVFDLIGLVNEVVHWVEMESGARIPNHSLISGRLDDRFAVFGGGFRDRAHFFLRSVRMDERVDRKVIYRMLYEKTLDMGFRLVRTIRRHEVRP